MAKQQETDDLSRPLSSARSHERGSGDTAGGSPASRVSGWLAALITDGAVADRAFQPLPMGEGQIPGAALHTAVTAASDVATLG
jgi:hypothetical protein